MKNDRSGKAAIISPSDERKIRRAFLSDKNRLIFDLALYTGERWGAILQLRVNDCYYWDKGMHPREEITFRAATRKRNRKGIATTRQVPVSSSLKDILAAYSPPPNGYLFPSPKNEEKPLSYNAAEENLRNTLARARLSHKGISTHSTRRTFITRLSEGGIDIRTIQSLTGHKSLTSLQGYIEENPKRKAKALEVLSL